MRYVMECECVVRADGSRYPKEVTLAQTIPGGDVTILFHLLLVGPCLWQELPRKHKDSSSWLFRKRHGLHFRYGHMDGAGLKARVEACVPVGYVIFTKGLEKARVLEEITGYPILSLDAAPNIDEIDLQVDCHFNHSKIYCSKRKAIFYARWLNENPEQVNLIF